MSLRAIARQSHAIQGDDAKFAIATSLQGLFAHATPRNDMFFTTDTSPTKKAAHRGFLYIKFFNNSILQPSRCWDWLLRVFRV
jgi:hypothetical protein